MIFNVEPHEKEMFELISQVAAELGFPAYVVGGYVRDRLLRRNSNGSMLSSSHSSSTTDSTAYATCVEPGARYALVAGR